METVVARAADDRHGPDRRSAERQCRVEDHGIESAVVRPGHRARVIDVSATGVLLETSYRLLPGRSVEVQMQSGTRRETMRGSVVRCAVARLRASVVAYRGAIQFDRGLPWLVKEPGREAGARRERPAHPCRADATPEIL